MSFASGPLGVSAQDDDNPETWPKYIAWTALSAVCAAIGTELGKWAIEEIKAARKPKEIQP